MEEEKKVKESKREKFRRLAAARTNKILAGIRTLKHLSSRAAYEYTDSEVGQMFGEIESALAQSKAAFDNAPKQVKIFEFTETE